MDYRQKITIIDELAKEKKRERILLKLDIAEAINQAYIGSQADKHGRNVRGYKRWRDTLLRQLYPDIPRPTIWQKVKKKEKRIKV